MGVMKRGGGGVCGFCSDIRIYTHIQIYTQNTHVDTNTHTYILYILQNTIRTVPVVLVVVVLLVGVGVVGVVLHEPERARHDSGEVLRDLNCSMDGWNELIRNTMSWTGFCVDVFCWGLCGWCWCWLVSDRGGGVL